MLQMLSDGAKKGVSKFILVGFLFLAVAGLVLTDVGGFFNDGVSSTNVATVGGEPIPYDEFHRILSVTLAQRGLTPQSAYPLGLVHDILERHAQDLLFVQEANKMGLYISDQVLTRQVHEYIAPFVAEGSTPQQALDQMTAARGLREQDLLAELRNEMTMNLLRRALASGAKTAPDLLLQELTRYRNETRDVEYIILPNNAIELEENISEEDILEFYEVSKTQEYRIPERRAAQIAIFDPTNVKYDGIIEETELRRFYDRNPDLYTRPAGREIEQAIMETEEEALRVMEEVTSGKTMREAAGIKYRRPQIFQEENALPGIAEVMFAESEEDLRGPVESPLGWHVIRVLGDTEETLLPFEDVQASIRVRLEREAKEEQINETLDLVENNIDDGVTLDELAAEFEMESLVLPSVDAFGTTLTKDEPYSTFEGDQVTLLEMLFDLFENEVSEMIELADGRFAVMRLTAIEAEGAQPLEDVRENIRTRLISNRKREANEAKAQEYLNLLLQDELTLENISNQENIDIIRQNNVPRSATAFNEVKIAPGLRDRLFEEAVGSPVIFEQSGTFILAKSSNSVLPPPAEISEEERLNYEQMTAIQIISAYYNHLSERTPVNINENLLGQLYGQE